MDLEARVFEVQLGDHVEVHLEGLDSSSFEFLLSSYVLRNLLHQILD
jgi:hypothetical protein